MSVRTGSSLSVSLRVSTVVGGGNETISVPHERESLVFNERSVAPLWRCFGRFAGPWQWIGRPGSERPRIKEERS